MAFLTSDFSLISRLLLISHRGNFLNLAFLFDKDWLTCNLGFKILKYAVQRADYFYDGKMSTLIYNHLRDFTLFANGFLKGFSIRITSLSSLKYQLH